MAVILLCMAAFAAQATTTVDYMAGQDPNGGSALYEVTKDAITKVAGSGFPGTVVTTDGSYVYVVQDSSDPQPAPAPAERDGAIVTYQIINGKAKKVASLKDGSFYAGYCGSCRWNLQAGIATPEHLFIPIESTGDAGASAYVQVLHKHTGGSLNSMCDIGVPFSVYNSPTSVTGIKVDANEHYAYITYLDYDTQIPVVGVYDISTSACKKVGAIDAAGGGFY